MSTVESTLVMTILQNAEKMTAKGAKEFWAWKPNSVILFCHDIMKTCPHFTVGWRVQKRCDTWVKRLGIVGHIIEEETALCYQSIYKRCKQTPTRNGPTNNEVGPGGYDISTTCLLEENGTLPDIPCPLFNI